MSTAEAKPGITCRKCLGRIDETSFEWKRRLHAKSSRPYSPPVLCSTCSMTVLLTFAYEDDDDLSDELGMSVTPPTPNADEE